MKRILTAGIGNIFLGDDAFGVEVAQALSRRAVPPEVEVMDFGIRSYDLAYALAEPYEAVILVDATQQGEPPGTLYVIEPDLEQLGKLEAGSVDGHSLEPVRVLQMAAALGGRTGRLYLVGCEPGDLGAEAGRMGLSEPVEAAVPKAVNLIETLWAEVLRGEPQNQAGLAPA